MTFRAKPVVKRAHRPSWETSSRRNFYLNIGFGLVVLLAVLILAAAAGASYYGDHFAAVAKVKGATITKDDFRELVKVETFRLSRQESKLREQQQLGRISDAEFQLELSRINQERQSNTFATDILEKAIDREFQGQLASEMGISVSDPDVEARFVEEATTEELRHAWLIAVKPEVSDGATEPTSDQKTAARTKAEKALADIKGGKSFEEIAKAVSADGTAEKGGDLGWIKAGDTSRDEALVAALFKLDANGLTDPMEGTDGIWRIGRVSEIAAKTTDAIYKQRIADANVKLDVYTKVLRGEIASDRLKERILADVVDTATPQRKVSEIYLAKPQGSATEGQVKARHILYSPNDDPQGAAALAAEDPAWKKAEDEARAAYEKLKADPSQFAEIAKTESDDQGSGASGGDLPYFSQSEVDPAFGAAIFKEGLTKDQILEPVKSQFGWHVIQFVDRRPPAQERIKNLAADAKKAGADFAKLAKDNSEGPEADKGGDLGWVARNQLGKELEDAIFKAPIGQVSEVLETTSGFYLFNVEKEETRTPDADQAKTLKQTAFSNWYSAKRQEAEDSKAIERDPKAFSQNASS